jgi:hypothetical protein
MAAIALHDGFETTILLKQTIVLFGDRMLGR